MDLCLHLLRLRANPEQLKAWNAGKHEPNQTHRTQGWTAFLKELVPVDEVNNIGTDKEHPQKPVKRVEIFTALYDLAQMEEEYQKGECGKSSSSLGAGCSHPATTLILDRRHSDLEVDQFRDGQA